MPEEFQLQSYEEDPEPQPEFQRSSKQRRPNPQYANVALDELDIKKVPLIFEESTKIDKSKKVIKEEERLALKQSHTWKSLVKIKDGAAEAT